MTIVWHLIKKDLRRLRWPLVLFSLLLVGEIGFYATVAGLMGAADLDWMHRLMSGPELALRTLIEPLVTYLLVGWLVFEDSPLEQDAHWVTRPLSGGQVFAAKLGAAALVFILWPLALNLLWWLACGAGGHEIIVSAREFAGVYLFLVSVGLACAALTDGFPRFILWSLVGVAVYFVVQLMFNLSAGPSEGLALSRWMIGSLACSLGALALAAHQFVTRRRRRSLVLAVVGFPLAGGVGALWPWDFVGDGAQFAPESPASSAVTLQSTGPIQLQTLKTRYNETRHYMRVPLKIDGLPDGTHVAWIRGAGDWSFAGERAWTSTVDFKDPGLSYQAMQYSLGFRVPPAEAGRCVLPLLFSLPLAQRAAREAAALHVAVKLQLMSQRLAAELPLREAIAPAGARACTISQLTYGRRKPTRAEPSAAQPMVVSLLLTERSAGGLRANATRGPGPFRYALVNRRTGQWFGRDPAQSGWVGAVQLNQVEVTTTQLAFLVGTAPIPLEDLTLAIVRVDRGESISRVLDINPVVFVQAAP